MAMVARRSKLDPDLGRWLSEAPVDAARTVLVRLGPAGDPHRAGERLRELGAELQDVGSSVIVVRATPPVLRHIADLPWVVSVELPQRLSLA